jgi:hypothetical protein
MGGGAEEKPPGKADDLFMHEIGNGAGGGGGSIGYCLPAEE